MSKPELIVFDLAGTTVEDNYHDVSRALQKAMEDYRILISLADANSVMGIPKPIAIEQLLVRYNHPTISPGLIMDIYSNFEVDMIRFYKNDQTVCEKKGVSETFLKLRAENIKIAVDTGFDRSIANALLERMGWLSDNLIDASVTSDEVERGRPFPDMIFKAMALTGVADVTHVAKVGDTRSDIHQGKSAGCGWVIGITSGAFAEADLKTAAPTSLIESIPQILDLFHIN